MTTAATNNEYVVAFTNGSVYAGRYGEAMSLVGSAGQGLTGPCIETLTARDTVDGKTKLWAVDGSGSIIVDVLGNTVTSWQVRVNTNGAGQLPLQCELAAIYQGRAFIARQGDNRRIYYASRIDNPLDWDFGAVPLPTAAFAGTNAEVGLVSDEIVSLMPFRDDYMVFGGSNSLWAMVGDPGAQGRVYKLSDTAGVLGPRAFVYDDQGFLWYLGTSGLYVLAGPTSIPENISERRLIDILDQVNVEDTLIQLTFDAYRRNIHIFLTPRDGTTAGVHAVYEKQSKSFWLDEYANVDIGPWAVAPTAGVQDEHRRFVMGGDDGIIRRPDRLATSDDGSDIATYIDFAPFELEHGTQESMATELQTSFHQGTGDLTYRWFTADSPDEVRQLAVGSEQTSGTLGIKP